MKGLIRVTGSQQAHVLQAVHELYDIVAGIEWSDLPIQQQEHNRLVIIGRDLDEHALRQGFLRSVDHQ